MMGEWVPGQHSWDLHGRRVFDKAQGILIGLRRCSSDTAFHELLGAARSHQIPVFTMAWALVDLASGQQKSVDTHQAAQSAARHEWGRLLGQDAVLAS